MDAESLKRAVQYGIANGKKNMIVDLDILGDILASRVPVGSNTLTPEELTERFYIVRGQRDQLIAAIQKIGRWCDGDEMAGQSVFEIGNIVRDVREKVLFSTDTATPIPIPTVALEIAARVWCDQEMGNCVMDTEAAEAIARIIDGVRVAQSPKDDTEPEQLEGFDCRADFSPTITEKQK